LDSLGEREMYGHGSGMGPGRGRAAATLYDGDDDDGGDDFQRSNEAKWSSTDWFVSSAEFGKCGFITEEDYKILEVKAAVKALLDADHEFYCCRE